MALMLLFSDQTLVNSMVVGKVTNFQLVTKKKVRITCCIGAHFSNDWQNVNIFLTFHLANENSRKKAASVWEGGEASFSTSNVLSLAQLEIIF